MLTTLSIYLISDISDRNPNVHLIWSVYCRIMVIVRNLYNARMVQLISWIVALEQFSILLLVCVIGRVM